MVGTQVGNYRIEQKLGEGGMGVVYRAVDVNLDRVVAIKALNTELRGNAELEQRFPGLIRAIVTAHTIQSADKRRAKMAAPKRPAKRAAAK